MKNINNDKDILVYIQKLYYSTYEYFQGNGFYPETTPTNYINKGSKYSETLISFIYIKDKKQWKQIDGKNINGLDKNEGYLLLNILNSSNFLHCNTICDKYNRKLYYNI